jgi:hypothetical protein
LFRLVVTLLQPSRGHSEASAKKNMDVVVYLVHSLNYYFVITVGEV